MKDFVFVLFVSLASLFVFLFACWLIAVLGSPLLVSFGLPSLTMRTVSGGMLAFLIMCYIVDFFAPKRK